MIGIADHLQDHLQGRGLITADIDGRGGRETRPAESHRTAVGGVLRPGPDHLPYPEGSSALRTHQSATGHNKA